MDLNFICNELKNSLNLERILIIHKVEVLLIPNDKFEDNLSELYMEDVNERFLDTFKQMIHCNDVKFKLVSNAVIEVDDSSIEEDFKDLSERL